MRVDEKHCTIQGIVVWDGITKPELDTPVGKPKYSIKILIHPQQPDLADVFALANEELVNGKYKGQLPPGGLFAISEVRADEYGGAYPGYLCVNGGTYNGAPQVFDINGNQLDAMTYGSMLYPGAVVDLLVHFYTYDNKSKGVATGLDGIKVVDVTTPRIAVGAGYDAGLVFGQGTTQPGLPPAQPGMVQQPGLPPAQPGMVPAQPGMVQQPGLPPAQPGMVPAQPGMVPAQLQQPGLPPAQPGMVPAQLQPGMVPANPGLPPTQVQQAGQTYLG